jgi:aminocarboxymuconate-semialdehyde decarboxylase
VAKSSHTAARPPRIDIHTHVAFPEVLAMARAIKVRGNGPGKRDWVPSESRQEHARQTRAIDDKLTDPRARLADMKAMGVDMQVVSMNLPTPCYWANARKGAKIARACNTLMAEFVGAMPDRYVGIGVVALQDMDATLKELDYLVHELGLRGVQIPSNVRNHDLGEAHFRPFWAKLEALGIPAIVHPRGFNPRRPAAQVLPVEFDRPTAGRGAGHGLADPRGHSRCLSEGQDRDLARGRLPAVLSGTQR